MNENIINWNAHEFKVYLLLYAANADFELTKEEKEIILLKATKTEYQHIHKIFEKDTDIQRIETILSFHEKFFPTEEMAEIIITEIYDFLKVNGEININEENFLRNLKKIMKF